MKVIINKFTKEVEFLSHHAEFAETNINVAGTFIAGADNYEIFTVAESSIPKDYKRLKYRLINGVFKKNEVYKEDNTEFEIEALKVKTAKQDDIINDLIISMLM